MGMGDKPRYGGIPVPRGVWNLRGRIEGRVLKGKEVVLERPGLRADLCPVCKTQAISHFYQTENRKFVLCGLASCAWRSCQDCRVTFSMRTYRQMSIERPPDFPVPI